MQHPRWAKDATIYQVHTRHFTPEGTFAAASRELDRLRELGVDIVWLTPVHEIGRVHRKGSLGSPYSVRDHHSVSPELGTVGDLKAFVDGVHARGMYVILDWVANHTAWDHLLVEQHPEWYKRDWKGDLRPNPWLDWSDVIDLDFSQDGVRRYMLEAMKYWVSEVGVDGYRCDVAGFVPLDFWAQVRRALDGVKPVFMLAEWESRDLHAEAFDATYAWSWYEAMRGIASGHADVSSLHRYYSWRESAYPADSMRMTFVSNHDKNAWDGTQFEQFGDALDAAVVLSVVGDGIPLLYNGQEAGNPRRLHPFDRDPIVWRSHRIGELYRGLFSLKHRTSALWNAPWGASMVRVPNDAEARVLSFVRRDDRSQVFAAFNLSHQVAKVAFRESLHHGTYTEYFMGRTWNVDGQTELTLDPWGYRVFVR